MTDEHAIRKVVILGPELDGRVVIESGLSGGDTLVTLGQSYLDDGMSVNVTAVE